MPSNININHTNQAMIVKQMPSYALAATFALGALAKLTPTAAAAEGAPAPEICQFVQSYSVAFTQDHTAPDGVMHLVTAVEDFGLMGERLSAGDHSIEGSIHATGNDISFTCSGTEVVVTNLSADQFAAHQTGSTTQYPESYSNWSANVPGGELGDGDQDGFTNLLEYALGLDPSIADRPMLDPEISEAQGAGAILTLRYPRDLSRADVTVEVQTSTDLTEGSWTGDGVDDILLSTEGAIENRLARIPVRGRQQFMRLVARRL